MAEKEKVTTMVLDVDLQCSKCYKRVKKLLCKFPEIQDQAYDEKANKVTIKVVSGSPEKIRDKLLCKGRGCIKSIEIKEPPKPKPQPPPEKKKEEQKKPPEEKEKKAEDSKDKAGKKLISIDVDLPRDGKPPEPVRVKIPVEFCCWGCCSGGPCWRDGHCGKPDGHCGRKVCDCWGWGCYKCDYAIYCTEENQSLCAIM